MEECDDRGRGSNDRVLKQEYRVRIASANMKHSNLRTNFKPIPYQKLSLSQYVERRSAARTNVRTGPHNATTDG